MGIFTVSEVEGSRLDWLLSRVSAGYVLILGGGRSGGLLSLLLASRGVDSVYVCNDGERFGAFEALLTQQPSDVTRRIQLMVGDYTNLPFADGVFGHVVIGDVEGLPQPARLWREVKRLLPPNGEVVVSLPLAVTPDGAYGNTFYLVSLFHELLFYFYTRTARLHRSHDVRFVGRNRPLKNSHDGLLFDVLDQIVRQREKHSLRELKVIAGHVFEVNAKLREENKMLRQEIQQIVEQPFYKRMRKIGDVPKDAGIAEANRQLSEQLEKVVAGLSAEEAVPVTDGYDRPFSPPDAGNLLDDFLRRVHAGGRKALYLFCTDSPFVHHVMHDRVSQLARHLTDERAAVLVAYGDETAGEAYPLDIHRGLLQLPRSVLSSHLDRLLRRDFGSLRRYFVVTQPSLASARWLNVFKAKGWVPVYDLGRDWVRVQPDAFDASVETYVIHNADLIVTGSDALLEKVVSLTKTAENVRVVPNGADEALLESAEALERTGGGGTGVTVGYIGNLSRDWLDWDVLLHLARAEPGWTFELIGQPPFPAVKRANVKVFPLQGDRFIVERAANWAVAMLPLTPNGQGSQAVPEQVYQYGALGLPTVASEMPDVASVPHVRTAADAAEFHEVLRDCVNQSVSGKDIRGWARRRLWANRTQDWLRATERVAPKSLLYE